MTPDDDLRRMARDAEDGLRSSDRAGSAARVALIIIALAAAVLAVAWVLLTATDFWR